MYLRQQSTLVRSVCVASALDRVGPIVAAARQDSVFVIAFQHTYALAAAGCLIERSGALHLPGDTREPDQARLRQPAGETAESGAEAAAKVHQLGFFEMTYMEPGENLRIHLFQHRLPMQRIGARAVVAEVHVELAAPGGVVRTCFPVVLLQADLRCDLGLHRGRRGRLLYRIKFRGDHFSPLALRWPGSHRVMPAPRWMRLRSVLGGSLAICPYQL